MAAGADQAAAASRSDLRRRVEVSGSGRPPAADGRARPPASRVGVPAQRSVSSDSTTSQVTDPATTGSTSSGVAPCRDSDGGAPTAAQHREDHDGAHHDRAASRPAYAKSTDRDDAGSR